MLLYEWSIVTIENDLIEIKKTNPKTTLTTELDETTFNKYNNAFLKNVNLANSNLFVPFNNLNKNLIYTV